MSYTFLYIALAVAIVDWMAAARRWKALEYAAKPGVMLALLAFVGQASGFQGPMLWFALGLFFSLAGDVLLMLPRDLFIPGLASFLLAHIAYVIGFNLSPPPVNTASFILAVGVAASAGQFYRCLDRGLVTSWQRYLRLPVLVYCIAITLMLLSALFTLVRTDNPQTPHSEDWQALPALLVSAGALLFVLSDANIGWKKCVAPLPLPLLQRHDRLRILVTYHLGQILITLGAVLHFMGIG